MKILNNYRSISLGATEDYMQEQVDLFLKSYKFEKWDPSSGNYGEYIELPKVILREFRVPEVRRISDHVLLINNRRVINIECKLDDIGGVINQAKDHLAWADYSVICLPSDGRYVPNCYKEEILKEGLGLWYWFKDIGIFEFILPKFNRNKDKKIRKEIITRVKNSK